MPMPALSLLFTANRLVLAAIALSLPLGALRAADPPNYLEKPNFVEYDVDPVWPARPDHVKPFGWVSGIDLDAHNNVWLFNKGEDPVQVYTVDGQFVRTWGKGKFDQPHQLRIDALGNVWVADFGLHVVQKFTPEGQLLLTLGIKGASGLDERHLNKPTDMAVNPAGDVFVTDGYGNRRIVHFDKDGNFVKQWGDFGTGPGQFVLPHAITLDAQGRLYVADRNSGRIQVFDQQGKQLDQWEGLIMPWGLSISRAADGTESLWACGSSPHWWRRPEKYKDSPGGFPEFKDQLFIRFSTDGRAQQIWTVPLGAEKNVQPGQTRGAHCIVADAQGNLYVGDIYGERAQKFVPVSKPGDAAGK